MLTGRVVTVAHDQRTTAVRLRRREQLRDLLRTCRARLAPADVGVVAVGRHRTPGLRREEVAALAGVGVSWYTWLEQGRDITVSSEVLDAVSRALRLTDLERAHLYLPAGLNPPRVGGVLLASGEASYVNGQDLVVDGGLVAAALALTGAGPTTTPVGSPARTVAR